MRARKALLSCFRQEFVQRADELGGRLDVWAVPRGKLLQPSLEQRRKLARGSDRQRIERPVQNEGSRKRDAGCGLLELRPQIIISQTLPDRFLRAGVHAKRREVLCVVEIAKVPGDGQLEGAPLIGSGVTLAQAAGSQRVALALDLRRRHAARE